MSEESHEPNKSETPSGNAPLLRPSTPAIPVSPQKPISGEAEANNASQNEGSPATKRELHILEKINIFGQLGLVVVGVVAASIYGCQLHTMNGQLTQMKGSGGQTDNLICLYRQQLGRLDASIGQASRLAEAMETANNNTLAADRPWFTADFTVTDFEAGKMPRVTVLFQNTGKRPALIKKAAVQPREFVTFPSNPSYDKHARPPGRGIIVPGATSRMSFNPVVPVIGEDEFARWSAGNPYFFIYAKVDYVDIKTGITHFAHFCWQYIGNTPGISKDFYSCPTYQDTDEQGIEESAVRPRNLIADKPMEAPPPCPKPN